MQQVDVNPKVSTPVNIETADPLEAVMAQVVTNKKDLPAAATATSTPSTDAQGGHGRGGRNRHDNNQHNRNNKRRLLVGPGRRFVVVEGGDDDLA